MRSVTLAALTLAACDAMTTVSAPVNVTSPPRMTEEAFLAKWGDIVTQVSMEEMMVEHGHGRNLQGNPFAMLMAAIQQITNTWQSIVNAFKSSYKEEIVDKQFGNGWSKFKASTKVFKGAGLEYAKSDEFFTDIQSMVDIPSKYKKDFNDQIKWIKFFDNITWSEHNTQFASDSGGSDTMFTMYARNREDDQKIDCLFLTVGEEFKLAPNYFVISESKSILGGLFSSTKLKFKKMDAGITDEQLMFVSEYFSLLAYQQIALAEGMQAPPDPSFPPSPPPPPPAA